MGFSGESFQRRNQWYHLLDVLCRKHLPDNLDMRDQAWCLDDWLRESQDNEVFHRDGERIQ